MSVGPGDPPSEVLSDFDQRLLESYARDRLWAPHAELCFDKLAVLGRGGMGSVFRVEDRRLGRQAALKVMNDPLAEPEEQARFLREASLMGRLTHPSIPPLYEAGRTRSGQLYALMKIIEGETLRDRIARQREAGFPEADMRVLLEVLLKVCEAMAYAHAEGVIHRDLKPSNIMIGRFGEVMVLDWGIARDRRSQDTVSPAATRPDFEAPDLTQPGSVMGTLGYMPPEQARGEEVDERADVFALGAILCEIVSGAPPIAGQSAVQRYHNTTQGKIRSPAQIRQGASSELDSLARSALKAERSQRLSSAEVFAAELRRFLAGERIEAHGYDLRERARRVLRRYPLALLASTLIALMGLGLLVLQGRARAAREAAELADSRSRADRKAADDRNRLFEKLSQAERLAQRGARLSRIEPLITDARALAGDSRPVLLKAAEIYLTARALEEALAVLDLSISREERPYDELFMKHQIQMIQMRAKGLTRRSAFGDTPAYKRLLEISKARGDETPLSLLREAARLRKAERFEEALAIYNKIEEITSTFPYLYNDRGITYARLGRFEEARRDYEKAIRLDPNYERPYSNIGSLYYRQKKYAAAKYWFELALEIDPSHKKSRLNRGYASYRLGQFQDAARDFAELLETSPENEKLKGHLASSLVAAGRASLRAGRHAAALDQLTRAIAADPKRRQAYLGRSRALAALGRSEEARRDRARAEELGAQKSGDPAPDRADSREDRRP